MTSVMGKKGQVTIPKPLRDSLGLAAGSRLEFEERSGEVVLRKAAARDPIADLIGLLPRMDVDAAIRANRGPTWSGGGGEDRSGQFVLLD